MRDTYGRTKGDIFLGRDRVSGDFYIHRAFMEQSGCKWPTPVTWLIIGEGLLSRDHQWVADRWPSVV